MKADLLRVVQADGSDWSITSPEVQPTTPNSLLTLMARNGPEWEVEGHVDVYLYIAAGDQQVTLSALGCIIERVW